MIDKDAVFDLLKRREKDDLLAFLSRAFDEMSPKQHRAVFLDLVQKSRPVTTDGAALLEDVQTFHRESLAGQYYAPFNINSKNFSRIPDKTDEWCDRVADLLKQAMKLTSQKDHTCAVKCFVLLVEVIGKMEYGEEIVFADEMGSWMIPIEDKEWIAAYLKSLAATTDPDTFAVQAIVLIRRDSGQSFYAKAYESALNAANKEQKARLETEIKRNNVRTAPESRRSS